MDYFTTYTTIVTLVSSHSQFLLLLAVVYCTLKLIHLEKDVRFLQYDFLTLKEELDETEDEENDEYEGDEDEDEGNQENEKESKEEMKDGDYEPDDTSSDEEE
jgi:predicted Holliday junction resolvase-like endonuclease